MAREFAKPFYDSLTWRRCRKAYANSRSGLCERCLARGLIVPGTVVHHKIPLTPENIRDPRIALSFNNLILVCADCHAELHKGEIEVGYYFAADGSLITK